MPLNEHGQQHPRQYQDEQAREALARWQKLEASHGSDRLDTPEQHPAFRQLEARLVACEARVKELELPEWVPVTDLNACEAKLAQAQRVVEAAHHLLTSTHFGDEVEAGFQRKLREALVALDKQVLTPDAERRT
jgi:hypothetical protein